MTEGFNYTGRKAALHKFVTGRADHGDLQVVKQVCSEILEKEIEDTLLIEKEGFIDGFNEELRDAITLILTPSTPEDDKENAEEELGSADQVIVETAAEIVVEVSRALCNALQKKRDIPIVQPLTPDSIAKAVEEYISSLLTDEFFVAFIGGLDETVRMYVSTSYEKAKADKK